VRKTRPDAFEDTSLHDELQGVQRLVICGQQSDCCIDATVHGALARGYEVVLAAAGAQVSVVAAIGGF
jgi:nicotinamidase-related amidase